MLVRREPMPVGKFKVDIILEILGIPFSTHFLENYVLYVCRIFNANTVKKNNRSEDNRYYDFTGTLKTDNSHTFRVKVDLTVFAQVIDLSSRRKIYDHYFLIIVR